MFVFPANGKNSTFALCRFPFLGEIEWFQICHEHVNYFRFFLVNLFNDSRKSKDNQLQGTVCRRMRWLISLISILRPNCKVPFAVERGG